MRGRYFGDQPRLLVGGEPLVVERREVDAETGVIALYAKTVPNYPGPATVMVQTEGGLTDTLLGGFIFVDELSISHLTPAVVRAKQSGSNDRVDLVGKGFHSGYYLYVPNPLRRDARGMATLLVQPNNSGRTSDDIAAHERDAWMTGFERKRIADELGVALLVPAFPRTARDWKPEPIAIDTSNSIQRSSTLLAAGHLAMLPARGASCGSTSR